MALTRRRSSHQPIGQATCAAGNELPPSVRSKIALVFVHFPLSMHRFATPAARAAKCARVENRFPKLVEALFNKQDSLGLKTWVSYGIEAGIIDTAAFAQCAASKANFSPIEAGIALGKRLQVTRTPTVIVNGWRFASPPYDSLAEFVNRVSNNRPLYGK